MEQSPTSPTPVFLVEIDPTKKGVGQETATRGSTDKLREVTNAQMELAFAVVEKVAAQAATTLQALQVASERPTPAAMELEFGLSLNTALEAYFVKTAGEATLSVKLSWTVDPT